MIPRKQHTDKPAVVIELKWDKSASGALDQIREKQYGNALKDYQGNLLLVGINYDKHTKKQNETISSCFCFLLVYSDHRKTVIPPMISPLY